METPIEESKDHTEDNVSLTPTRDDVGDIVGGARQTDQLDQLQANAQKHNSGEQSTYVAPLKVNDGSRAENIIDENAEPNVENP
jgi:hypothetical protein